MRIRRLLLDFETFSPVSIDVGPNRQMAETGAGAWCCSWGFKANDEAGWRGPFLTVLHGGRAGVATVEARLRAGGVQVLPRDIMFSALRDAEQVVAHNAPYEMGVLRWVFGVELPIERWSCTLARSTRLGLPPALEAVLEVFGAPVSKDMVGNKLSKEMAKPRGYDEAGRPLWKDDLESVVRVCHYCVSDFVGEAWLDDLLPELEPKERGRWCRQTVENNRGINVDWDLVGKGLAVTEAMVAWLGLVLPEVTEGMVKSITSVADIRRWCERRGVFLTDLSAETLDLVLDSRPDLPDDVRDVLEARRSIRTSTSKLEALRARRMPSHCGEAADRVCDLTQWGGARTLRTVGRGFQPLNLPRPGDVDVDAGLKALRAMDFEAMCLAVNKDARERKPTDNAGVKTFRHAAMMVMPSEVVSACLRATLIPTKGKKFVAVDYSGVEMRGTFALARQMDVIEGIRAGADTYCDLATEIYGYEVKKKEHPEERQLGKQGILGCGFALSNPETFKATCAGYGLYISTELAEKVIKTFQEKYYWLPILWKSLQKSIRTAMQEPGEWKGDPAYGTFYRYSPVGLGGLPWLECWLPSGRIMYYPNAKWIVGQWGPTVAMSSWKNGQWVEQHLSKQVSIENVIQAICRDAMEDDKEDILASGRCDVVLTVYDEILAEFSDWDCIDKVQRGKHEVPAPQAWMEDMMSRELAWFPAMPRGAEGWTGTEYHK